MMKSRITVAICTWNRAELLSQTLEALAHMSVPAGLEWELLVVNNGCTDQTDQVLSWFSNRLPLQRVYEPTLGLSHARNCAVANATGDYIIWTDDDVLVPETWLSEYAKAFERYPNAVVFGGPVLPRYASPPPTWLERMWPQAAGYYAMRKCPGRPVQISSDYVPNGANYALRMEVQRQHRYEPELGRKGALPFGGEEWQVIDSVLRDGGIGWWLPGTVVEHWLPSERLTTRYLRRVIRCQGQFAARKESNPIRLRLLGRPLTLWRKVVLSELRYRWHRLTSRPEIWFPLFQRASFLQGQFRGH
jgi:glycosyltransferase involved in cell wall biosynthesis